MEKKFKIILPEQKVSEVERESVIRKMFKDDKDKGGILSSVFVFTYISEPITVTEIKDKIQNYYKKEIDRVSVFRAVDRLHKLGLFNKTTTGEVIAMEETEDEDITLKLIRARHRGFLLKISPQFRSRYNNVNYVWVSNGFGIKFIKWCCEINGFKIEK